MPPTAQLELELQQQQLQQLEQRPWDKSVERDPVEEQDRRNGIWMPGAGVQQQ
ncbi:MAG: hypothetical protein JOZ73_09740 [Solirubrobacterales bacterium]|nr:hypothetical protein [Solirubrobacterales bacterium]